ncbi:MAG TPA: GFA family protein [Phenylobacterium sp.]|nr:GFA family protein [Phenylobacterium sp.]
MSGETGGCQCGAVRFRVTGELGRPSICHCRMCQKAFGAFFGPLVSVKVADLVWTRGAPKRFASSNKVNRGFCESCGTPLTFEWSPAVIDLAIGAFDDPAPLKPVVQMGLDSALPWVADLAALPVRGPSEAAQAEAHYASIVSYQHPDHDTEQWPQR